MQAPLQNELILKEIPPPKNQQKSLRRGLPIKQKFSVKNQGKKPMSNTPFHGIDLRDEVPLLDGVAGLQGHAPETAAEEIPQFFSAADIAG